MIGVCTGSSRRRQRATSEQIWASPRWLLVVALLALVVGSGVTAGCRASAGPSADVGVSLEVTPPHPSVGPIALTVGLSGLDGTPLDGAAVEVEGNMTHAGMVPVRAQATPAGGGRYVVSDFRLTMAGDWVITARGRLGDGRAFSRDFPLPGVNGPPGVLDKPGIEVSTRPPISIASGLAIQPETVGEGQAP